MKILYLEPTPKTPLIELNHLNGELILSGLSIPEDATSLYENVLQWITEYTQNPKLTTNLRFNLEYFNTSSLIWFARIFKVLGSIHDGDYTLIIHLYFPIEEFNNMEIEDIKDEIGPIIDMLGTAVISHGIKIYGTQPDGQILKESMVLL